MDDKSTNPDTGKLILSGVQSKLIAGMISGFIEVSVNQPLEFVKVQIQEAAQKQSHVNWNKIIHPKELYRGYPPRVLGIVPMRLAFWGGQSIANEHLHNYNLPLWFHYTCGGIVGGLCQTPIDTPIEVIKTHMMTNRHAKFLDIVKAGKFPGFRYNLARNIGFAIPVSISLSQKKDGEHTHNFLLGAVGGFIGSIMTQPIDYFKTYVQRHNSNKISHVAWELIKKHPMVLFSGWFPRALGGFCNMGIGSLIFIEVNRLLTN